MSHEEVNYFIERLNDMYNRPDIHIADTIFAPHFVGHRPIAPTLSRTSYKNLMEGFYSVFPDFRVIFHDTIVSSDTFVLRATYYGTHHAAFMGIPATGREVAISSIGIFRVADGLIVENWEEVDFLGALWQVSAVSSVN